MKITSHTNNTLYQYQQSFTFKGYAADGTSNPITTPSKLTWMVAYLDNGEWLSVAQGQGLSLLFQIPQDVRGQFYRVSFTATDGDGLSSTNSVDIFPDNVSGKGERQNKRTKCTFNSVLQSGRGKRVREKILERQSGTQKRREKKKESRKKERKKERKKANFNFYALTHFIFLVFSFPPSKGCPKRHRKP